MSNSNVTEALSFVNKSIDEFKAEIEFHMTLLNDMKDNVHGVPLASKALVHNSEGMVAANRAKKVLSESEDSSYLVLNILIDVDKARNFVLALVGILTK